MPGNITTFDGPKGQKITKKNKIPWANKAAYITIAGGSLLVWWGLS